MKILVVGGGTGGHIMPAVATVKEILELDKNAEVEFWTDRKNYKSVCELCEMIELETVVRESTVKRETTEQVGRKKVKVVKKSKRRDIVEGREVQVRVVHAGKFRRYAGWKKEDFIKHFWILIRDVIFKNIINAFLVLVGIIQSLIRLVPKDKRPDIVFLKGGYVGLPVGLVAGWLKIPYIVHESDATPGLANRILKKKARVFLLGMEKAEMEANEKYVGVPISDEFRKVSEAGQRKLKEEYGFSTEGKPVLIVVGGSQGSEHINNAVNRVLPELLKEVQVGIVTGPGHVKEFSEGAREALGLEKKQVFPEELKIWDFSKEVEKLFGVADLVVSRAGATTLAELAVMGKATILVPFEALPGGHQEKNARMLEQRGAAVVLLDEEMVDQPVKLLHRVRDLAQDEKKREKLGEEIKKTGKSNVAKTIAEIILEEGKISGAGAVGKDKEG